jgi:activator of HSP90 ATPase
VKDLVRKKIVPQLREKLAKLGPALIAEHGKDIQHAPGSGPASGTATPTYTSSSSTALHGKVSGTATPTSGAASTQGGTEGPLVNVTTVTDTEEFRTTAQELFQTFTDPQRIAAFTRAPPTVFEGARKGGKFELFGGNVSGEYVELEEPTRIVQLWRLKQWPAGHYSRLEIKFDQNDRDAVTIMRVNWDGVPIGQEEVTKRNWGEYYVVSSKLINAIKFMLVQDGVADILHVAKH